MRLRRGLAAMVSAGVLATSVTGCGSGGETDDGNSGQSTPTAVPTNDDGDSGEGGDDDEDSQKGPDGSGEPGATGLSVPPAVCSVSHGAPCTVAVHATGRAP